MKKAIIAAGASAVLAAMPVVGVFADQTLAGSNIDEVTFSLSPSCTMTATAAQGGVAITDDEEPANTIGYTYTIASITPGNASSDVTGTAMNIKCNDTGGWALKAVGTSTATTATSMDSSTDVDADDIVTGTILDGSVSNWAFKVTATGSTGTIANVGETEATYGSYAAIPASETTIVSYATPTDMTNGVTVTPSYKVGVKSTQAAGTYTGQVTYKLYKPAA